VAELDISNTKADSDLLADLTLAQQQAVMHTDGPLLVLAAAGSGKTRVITRRAAYLVLTCGIPPWNVLCITFTNKAAGEMRDRIGALLSPNQSRAMTIGTFHALCAKLLRRYADRAHLPRDFVIYDTDDQRSALKQTYKELDISTSNFEPAAVHSKIGQAKNNLIDAELFARNATDFFDRTAARLYQRYEQILAKSNALDFDDLLLRTAQLLQHDAEVRQELRERYRYIQVDEYQDTNHAQFVIAHALAAGHGNLCVVGDPDQSIYGWRGANIGNILDFETHYPQTRVIQLGQNYRSTPQILAIADRLIRNNRQRRHKELFTENPPGQDVRVVLESDEESEAQHVIGFLREQREAGVPWGQMAVFYRINALSRAVEESLLRHSIPYQVARGTAFYQRKEVKDALAYLRVIANPEDEVSMTRIINTPTRGIGDTTVEHLRAYAVANGLSLWEALSRCPADSGLNARAAGALTKFYRMLESWRNKVLGADEQALGFIPGVRDIMEMILRDSGLEAYYKDGKNADEEKLRNLYELVSAAQRFDEQYEDSGGDLRQRLHDYLESVALVSDVDAVEGGAGAVTLMTLHAAKGLEFQVVAMIGLEEGLLPHSRSRNSPSEMEEERRLCFVGITRSQQQLLITHAKYRTIRGLRERTIPSPFLKELGEEGVVREDRAVFGDSGWDRYDADAEPGDQIHSTGLHIGARVRHPVFGPGKVLSLSPARHPSRAKVYFDRFGAKTLVLEYARLELLD